MKVLAIRGKVQHYAWGGKDFIPQLLGQENGDDQAFAELWMGAHHRGPAQIEGQAQSLAELIEKAPEKILGEKVAKQFDQRLPFLFKILDVHKMLSIQTHPTKAQAVRGFEKEERMGIPLTAKHRNFKDDNHKPEIMIALTDFWLLHGFQSTENISKCLEYTPEFSALRPQFASKDIRHLYQYIMELPQNQVNELLAPLKKRLHQQNNSSKSHPDYWAKLAFQDYTTNGNFDRGIFSIYLFNLVQLVPGNAIFQAAGIPHAYLEGVNVELMANSDNVFRGGLTPKHIDVAELMKHLNTNPVAPRIFAGERISETEKIYRTPAPDFEVSQIQLKAEQSYRRKNDAPDILIILKGKVEVIASGKAFNRIKGEIFFAAYDADYEIVAREQAVLYRASVPV
ncbi:MAG: mannose-6-phosphate isomerase, class I [Bacteroidota bacterium]